jgi:hypothetical protein
VRELVAVGLLAPLLGSVGVADGHAADSDGVMDACDRRHARDPPARADDDLAVDLLAKDPVRAAYVVRPLGGDRRGLDSQPGLAHRLCRLGDDRVAAFTPPLEREVEAPDLHVKAEQRRIQQAQRLLQKLLARLIPLQRDYREIGHGRTICRAVLMVRRRSRAGRRVQGLRARG